MTDHLYQIYYSESSRQQLDPGFLPLDNRANPRPDWREYWPIRQFLLNTPLDEHARYGFFSPKFRAKTGLDAVDVTQFLAGSEAEVVLFSPFFDQSAFFRNVLLQSEQAHPGSAALFSAMLTELGLPRDPTTWVTHAGNTVFCNYFVATPAFWRTWLALCERLFAVLEADPAHVLNPDTVHDRGRAPLKVFLVERLATVLLTSDAWRIRACNAESMALADPMFGPYRDVLYRLDALKLAYSVHADPQYLAGFRNLRSALVAQIQRSRLA
jgi:hypothetical protein